MRIAIGGRPITEADLPRLDWVVTSVAVWYDREHFKTWVVTQFNKSQDQVGESLFIHHKQDAVKAAREIQESFGGVDKVCLSIGTKKGGY